MGIENMSEVDKALTAQAEALALAIGTTDSPMSFKALVINEVGLSKSGAHAIGTCRIVGDRENRIRIQLLFRPSALQPQKVTLPDGTETTVIALQKGTQFLDCKVARAMMVDETTPVVEGQPPKFTPVLPRLAETQGGFLVYISCYLVNPGTIVMAESPMDASETALLEAATAKAAKVAKKAA